MAIKSFDKILFETVVVNGTIDTEVPKEISILPEWKLTLQFEIATKKTSGILFWGLACSPDTSSVIFFDHCLGVAHSKWMVYFGVTVFWQTGLRSSSNEVVFLHSLAEREQDLSETGYMTAVNLSSIL